MCWVKKKKYAVQSKTKLRWRDESKVARGSRLEIASPLRRRQLVGADKGGGRSQRSDRYVEDVVETPSWGRGRGGVVSRSSAQQSGASSRRSIGDIHHVQWRLDSVDFVWSFVRIPRSAKSSRTVFFNTAPCST